MGLISGNFITAKPLGVIDGVDYAYSGSVRKINHELIQQQLQNHNLVLLSPIGSSLHIKWNTFTPRWTHRDYFGEPRVHNVTPELKQRGNVTEEWVSLVSVCINNTYR